MTQLPLLEGGIYSGKPYKSVPLYFHCLKKHAFGKLLGSYAVPTRLLWKPDRSHEPECR